MGDCDNGGTLDLESCTCSCKGDSLHGFHGSRCEKSYGTCQPGKGTSKFWAASQCREAGICRTWFHHTFVPTLRCVVCLKTRVVVALSDRRTPADGVTVLVSTPTGQRQARAGHRAECH